MSSFKTKALSSTFWSFFETFGNMGLQFIIGIILARLLVPEDYGIIGVLTIFMGISSVLVDSGFKTSIIRSKDLTDVDCSTIFYVNFTVSIFVGLLLCFSASSIADFFNKTELVNITKIFALIPVINGLGLVQSALLFKNLQFKHNARISIASNVISGGLGLFLAFNGFSYWALVWRGISAAVINTSLLWAISSWYPKFAFSLEILKKHFRFSSKLLLVGLLDTLFENIYGFIFGKFFSFRELGYYSRGQGYADLFTKTISRSINRVNSPILSKVNNSKKDIVDAHRKILNNSIFVIFPLCLGLAAIAHPLILILIGEKWLPSVIYLQLMCFSRLAYPIINSSASVFEVTGKSSLNLKYTIINRFILICVLIFSVRLGIIALMVGKIIHSYASAFIIMYMVTKVIKFKLKTQILDLGQKFIPSLIMALCIYFFVITFSRFIPIVLVLVFGIFVSIIIYYSLSRIFNLIELKTILFAIRSIFMKVKLIKSA